MAERFRSPKLVRRYGVANLRNLIGSHVNMAERFEGLARRQGREVRGGGGAQKLRDGVPPAATTTRRPLRQGFRIGDCKIF
ncbi:unnamed protein product [Musa hybrid cultivar]